MPAETSPFRAHPRGLVIEVLVVPGSSRNQIVGMHGTRLRVKTTAPPDGGRANKAVAAQLAEIFGMRVDLLSGASSRIKRYLLRGAESADEGALLRRIPG
jgi:uncharacterized protein (TIGR00251 family)